MSAEDIPDHLDDGPLIDEADFILDAFSQKEVTEIHTAIANLSTEVTELSGFDETRYLILGNYNKEKKRRLHQAGELLEYFNPNSVYFLLSDLDPEEKEWENFYIKFLYTLSFVHYSVLVAEDNDGGHELELGEVNLAETYIAKRSYEADSLNRDLEHEKYDAMINKLFEIMDRKDRLSEWSCYYSFAMSVKDIAASTQDSDLTSLDLHQGQEIEEEEEKKDEEETHEIPGEVDSISPHWEVAIDETANVSEWDKDDVYALEYVREIKNGVTTKIQTVIKHRYSDLPPSFRVEVSMGKLPGGRIINRTVASIDELDLAQELSDKYTHVFDHFYEETNELEEAMESAIEEIERFGE